MSYKASVIIGYDSSNFKSVKIFDCDLGEPKPKSEELREDYVYYDYHMQIGIKSTTSEHGEQIATILVHTTEEMELKPGCKKLVGPTILEAVERQWEMILNIGESSELKMQPFTINIPKEEVEEMTRRIANRAARHKKFIVHNECDPLSVTDKDYATLVKLDMRMQGW